jgi:hypothetical protein
LFENAIKHSHNIFSLVKICANKNNDGVIGESCMHFKTTLTIGILLAVFSSTTFAQSFRGFYLGGNFSQHRVKEIIPFGDRLKGVVLKAGYDITNFLAIEGQVGGTIKESYSLVDDQGQEVAGYDVRGENAGIYARANWRLRNITLYGLVGYGYYNLVEDFYFEGFMDESFTTDETGLSYGLGIDLFGSSRTAFSVSWMQLIDEETEFDFTLDVSAVYVGITYFFTPQKTTHAPVGR